MNALELLRYLTQVPFLIIFAVVAVQAVRRARRVTIDIAVFFGIIVIVFASGWISDIFDVTYPRWISLTTTILFLGMPYILLRLVADFAGAPAWILRVAEAGLIASAISLWVLEPPYTTGFIETVIGYWVILQLYVTTRFVLRANRATGVARRRLQAVALGSFALAVTLAVAGISVLFPEHGDLWTALSNVCALAGGIGYLFGFAPPPTLRRAWQASEFRGFLARSETLAHLSDTAEWARAVERGTMAAIGSSGASLGLWDESRRRIISPSYPQATLPPSRSFSDMVFERQEPLFTLDSARDFPEFAEIHRQIGARTMLGAPVSTSDRRYGTLVAFAGDAPLFADEDLGLLALLARQVALQLWTREALDRAASLAAREEATRLKEDFLSAAAHDLKTPLTTLLGQAQLMERRLVRQPDRPLDPEGLQRMTREALRMRTLIDDLLDASRPGDTGFVTDRQPADIVALVEDVVRDRDTSTHRFRIDAPGPVIANIDEPRMRQVFQNLVDNAVKYSPSGGEVAICVRADGDDVEVSVTDQGIGIDATDIPHVFQRFYRGAETNDRKFGGMGLGLYLVERIVTEHGGTVTVTSVPQRGSTFSVRVPIAEGASA